MIVKTLKKLVHAFIDLTKEPGIERLAFAEMSFYSITSGEPLNTYADQEECYLNRAPLIADEQGQFSRFIYIKKPYKVVVKNNKGNVIFKQDYLK